MFIYTFKVHTLLCTANNVTPNNRFVIRDFLQVLTSFALCSTADKVRMLPAGAADPLPVQQIKGNNKTGLPFFQQPGNTPL
jgi:hypothetical protein